jgi:hypothetical protein
MRNTDDYGAAIRDRMRLPIKIYSRSVLAGFLSIGAMISVPTLAAQQANPQTGKQPAAAVESDTVLEPSLAKAPQVTYQDEELTIVAENSRLSDVLSAIRACTGADLDIPVSASGERVWVRLGPGPARKVLATLLDGTSLDYVIQASDSDPDEVRSITLSPRLKPGATSTGAEKSVQAMPSRIPKANQPAQEFPAVENVVAVEPVAAPPAAPASGVPTSNAVLTSDAAPPVADSPRPAPSTTDQMIQKLENMYEQRKQMQSLASPPKPPGTN